MTEENTSGLSAEESAYFDSRGETDVPAVVENLTKPAEPANTHNTEPSDGGKLTELVDDPAAPLRDEKGKFVPHGALHAEREEHKKTREELRKVAERQAILDDRWNVTEREKAEQQTKQQQEQETAIWGHWEKDVQQFAAATPDFNDAAKHLADLRTTQLKALGYDEKGINRVINEELKGVIIETANKQQSPAQVIYEYAKASGYTGPKPADPVPAAPNGELPDKLKNIQNAQERSRTLSASPGGGAPNPDSTDALLAMSEADFAKWLEKGQFRKVMGG